MLELLVTLFENALPKGFRITADLPWFQPYIFLSHIAQTDERPDIVVWSDDAGEVWVIELTICFETNYEEAALEKPTDTQISWSKSQAQV